MPSTVKEGLRILLLRAIGDSDVSGLAISGVQDFLTEHRIEDQFSCNDVRSALDKLRYNQLACFEQRDSMKIYRLTDAGKMQYRDLPKKRSVDLWG